MEKENETKKVSKEENIEFLNLIYQNAEMGLIGIDCVMKKVEDEEISHLIKEQREEYEEFCNDAKKLLSKYGAKEEEISAIQKLSSKVMSELMSINKEDKNIVKLMMEGNEKGVIAIKEKLNMYEKKEGIDSEIIDLANRLYATEEHNREEFESYL